MKVLERINHLLDAMIFWLCFFASALAGVVLVGIDCNSTPTRSIVAIAAVFVFGLIVCKILNRPNRFWRHIFAIFCVVASGFQFVFHTNNRILRRLREVDFECNNLSEFYIRSLHMYDVASCLDTEVRFIQTTSEDSVKNQELIQEWAQFCLRSRNSHTKE